MEESASWWLDAHNRPPNQSPWLRAILSDLDAKIKTIVNLIEDDGDSFTERAELFYKRRPELLKTLRELHQSYKILAVSYDEIRLTNSARISQFRSPFSSFRFQQKDESPNPYPQKDEDSIAEGSEDEDEEKEKPEVLKLMEDNLRQQMELIRRNEEKREMIKQLKGQVSRLMEENRAMKGLISSYKPELQRTDSNNFKLKGLNCLGSFHSPY